MKESLYFVFFVLTYISAATQEYKKIKLTKEEINKGIHAHYQRDATDGHFIMFGLFLYKNGQFTYYRSDNLYPERSEGIWKSSNGKLTLRSTLQKNDLPIKVDYIPTDNQGKRRFAPIKNLKEYVVNAFVLFNTGTIGCYYGNDLCNGKYDNIYRIKVGLSNSDLESPWIYVKEGNETLQLTINTNLDLNNYTPFNKVFVIKDNKLIEMQ